MQLLRDRRGITEEMIREVIESKTVDASGYQEDEQRGERLWIVGKTYAKRPLFVLLYPVDTEEGLWRLGTARWD